MTSLMINGKIEHIQEKNFEGKTTTVFQFLARSEKKGFEVIKVKINDETHHCKVGDTVQIPVSISTMNNSIYYSQIGKIQKVS